MKPLQQNEIFQNLNTFLKTRGIELKEGSYAKGIQKSCSLLTDAINVSQQSLHRARVEVDKSIDQLRQRIHEKTAPKGAQASAASTAGKTAAEAKGKAKTQARKQAQAKKKSPRR